MHHPGWSQLPCKMPDEGAITAASEFTIIIIRAHYPGRISGFPLLLFSLPWIIHFGTQNFQFRFPNFSTQIPICIYSPVFHLLSAKAVQNQGSFVLMWSLITGHLYQHLFEWKCGKILHWQAEQEDRIRKFMTLFVLFASCALLYIAVIMAILPQNRNVINFCNIQ